jgi:LmbE family N-acetylglucosaminyl deacetylase
LGEKGTIDPASDDEELARIRRHEVERAAELLGIARTHFLGFPDGTLNGVPSLKAEVVRFIRAFRPNVVLAPDPTAVFFGAHYVNHVDHRALGWTVLDAVHPAARLPKYFPEAGPAHRVDALFFAGTLDATHTVDIGSAIDLKCAAVACHVSQVGDDASAIETIVRRRAREDGSPTNTAFGESFRVIGDLPPSS